MFYQRNTKNGMFYFNLNMLHGLLVCGDAIIVKTRASTIKNQTSPAIPVDLYDMPEDIKNLFEDMKSVSF